MPYNVSVTDLFEPVVPEHRLSEQFKTIAFSRGYAPARATLRETYGAMGSRDPNFVEQFQTTGLDARITELYLFAAFRGAGLDVSSVGDAPDFLVRGHGFDWAVEVTTANPSGGQAPMALPDDPAALRQFIDGELAVRLASALFSKLNKRYWELPHVRRKQLVLAIQNFATEDAQHPGDTALIGYLYGLRTFGEVDSKGRLKIYSADIESHAGSKTIPSNFFALPDAEHISAVLWTNSGTISKFSRIGFQYGLDSDGILMRRVGHEFVPHPDATDPVPFSYDVATRRERWEEGLVMAHNPRAAYPLPQAAFPGIVHHELDSSGRIRSTMPSFHAFTSRTLIAVSPSDDE